MYILDAAPTVRSGAGGIIPNIKWNVTARASQICSYFKWNTPFILLSLSSNTDDLLMTYGSLIPFQGSLNRLFESGGCLIEENDLSVLHAIFSNDMSDGTEVSRCLPEIESLQPTVWKIWKIERIHFDNEANTIHYKWLHILVEESHINDEREVCYAHHHMNQIHTSKYFLLSPKSKIG